MFPPITTDDLDDTPAAAPPTVAGPPVAKSILATDGLRGPVATTYGLGEVVSCTLIKGGWNDTYRIETARERYILRVWEAKRWSVRDIRYELALLDHLSRHGVAVSTAVPRADGHPLGWVRAPEGWRAVALFTHAPGRIPDPAPLGDAAHTSRIGAALAALHNAGDGFIPAHQRPPRDLTFLLDRPLATFRPLLAHRPAEWAYITGIADEMRASLTALAARGLSRGVVHRDPTSENATVTGDGTVTWYDFDFCGPGWTVQDVAAVYGTIRGCGHGEPQVRLWRAFLEGYRAVRPVTAAELDAILPLIVASSYFYMLVNLGYAVTCGNGYWGGDEHFDDWLTSLREAMGWYAEGTLLA